MLISFLINHLPVQWVRTHEIEFINSLLFILRELSPSISLETVDKASSSLQQVITVCHTPQDLAYGFANSFVANLMRRQITAEEQRLIDFVVDFLCTQLSAPNPRLRKSVHTMLETLASITGLTVPHLMVLNFAD